MTQRDMYHACLAEQLGTQLDLFPGWTEPESDLACEVCGSFLVRTSSGYLCCPRGHGKLLCEEE